MENNIELLIAKKQTKAAEIRLLEAVRNLGPELKILWEESSGKTSRHYTGRKLKGKYKQPMFRGGELIYTVNQTKVNLEILQNDYKKTKNGIVLAVQKAYYSLDKTIKAFDIQQKVYDKTKKFHDMITRGHDMGVISKLEYLNMAAKYNQIHFQFISAKEDITLGKVVMQQTMDIEKDIDIVPVEEPELNMDISLKDCYALAFANRPELRSQFFMMEYYFYDKKIQQAGEWLKVDLLGEWGYAIEEYVHHDLLDAKGDSQFLKKFAPEWNVGFKASMPFWGSTAEYTMSRESWQPVVSSFTHGAQAMTHQTSLKILDNIGLYADIEETNIGFIRSQNDYYETKQQIYVEVQETYFSYRKAILQLELAKSKLEYQRRQLDYVIAERELGSGTLMGELDAEIGLGEEEYSLLQAIADYYKSIKSLNSAVGILGYFDDSKY